MVREFRLLYGPRFTSFKGQYRLLQLIIHLAILDSRHVLYCDQSCSGDMIISIVVPLGNTFGGKFANFYEFCNGYERSEQL